MFIDEDIFQFLFCYQSNAVAENYMFKLTAKEFDNNGASGVICWPKSVWDVDVYFGYFNCQIFIH